jgi:hypothetical protein
MQKRGVRLGVVVAFVLAIVGVAYVVYAEHQRNTQLTAQAREVDIARDRALAALLDARASLLSALVPGQGEDYWLPRAATALETASAELATLKQQSLDGAALNDLEAAAAAIEQASSVRDEAKRYLAGDMRTQASRVVFADGVPALVAAAERIESARWTALARRDADLVASDALQALLAGGLVALALIVTGLLLPGADRRGREDPIQSGAVEDDGRVADAPTAHATPEPVIAVATEVTAGMHRGPATPAVTGVPAAATTAPAAVTRRPATPTDTQTPDGLASVPPDGTADGVVMPQRDRRKAPELRAAADLCTDFARLVDSSEMPSLLERASHLLDSTGFIVWLADDQARQLRPVLAHGYAPQALAKMPTIPRHADNATAAAFRHAEMQIVRTNGMSPGAIVTPILGPAGCVGVMAAEVRHGREASESSRALARIVAAQLSTLLGNASAQAADASDTAAEPGGTAARHVG